MFWQISFWLLVVLLIVPFPFKIYEYITRKDQSPLRVKVEEMLNAIFLAIGLIAFYGFINNINYFTPMFWKIWLVIAVFLSTVGFYWSPKIKYSVEIMGKKKVTVLMAFSTLIYLPMFIAVYQYAV
ncbi:hypothetical protein [Colwellia sp. Bg11-28]|uniref:hypothetical protein n=1 Tax=Colwellia sp. Bg11-28 TaxID=2058305 RepID=UPI000C344095|nr:hypothetical protein [Colwellia sp. Bg11-28]PKH87483.1 hypothetical protein CXF79_12590 [Colwellia sp. Bg11-28]